MIGLLHWHDDLSTGSSRTGRAGNVNRSNNSRMMIQTNTSGVLNRSQSESRWLLNAYCYLDLRIFEVNSLHRFYSDCIRLWVKAEMLPQAVGGVKHRLARATAFWTCQPPTRMEALAGQRRLAGVTGELNYQCQISKNNHYRTIFRFIPNRATTDMEYVQHALSKSRDDLQSSNENEVDAITDQLRRQKLSQVQLAQYRKRQ